MSEGRFSDALLCWFDLHGRKDLPWQRNRTAYRVWVSEIMLQQTQVSSVIPYYNRFMDSFPTVDALASAPLDEVLHHWAGLGYYARARNLHKAAIQVVDEWDGHFSESFEDIISLSGIGRSTAAAISCIAFKKRQPILDGNVKRVLARYHGVKGWPGERRVSDQLWQFSDKQTPKERVDDYTQAIMDLGATVCRRSKPQCERCPLVLKCEAHQSGLTDQLPSPRPKKKVVERERVMLILESKEGLFIERRASAGIWGGLWSFPLVDDAEAAAEWFELQGVSKESLAWLPKRTHLFTHFKLNYQPVRGYLKNPSDCVMEANRGVWYKAATESAYGFPAPVKKLMTEYEDNNEQNG
jgi:A/G-specific adenine glycosylase